VDGDLRSLLDQYEARGDDDLYARAKPRYEQAIAADPDPVLIRDYGYLLECHARRELRRAVEQYEYALALDPSADKVRYQKISAQAALGRINEEIRDYTAHVGAAPDDIRPYRYLARAYLIAQQYDEAGGAIDAGLALANQDRVLIECRGELRAGTGDTEGALADWRHALDLDPEDISPLYSTAFLYECEGRTRDALAAWTAIRDWAQTRGYRLDAEWPEQERQRLLSQLNSNDAIEETP
jgi:tetratricopeptide (TPR) repeat protein